MLSYAAQRAVRKWKFDAGAGTATVPVDVNFELGQEARAWERRRPLRLPSIFCADAGESRSAGGNR